MVSPSEQVHYEITPADPGAQLFEVSCRIAQPDAGGQRIELPTWIPGSYLVRDFAGKITRLEADTDAGPVAVEKVSKSAWQCAPCDGPLTVRYQVYANELNVRGAHIDFTHAYFNGPLVFVRPSGLGEVACTVAIRACADPRTQDWRVATSMPQQDVDEAGYGVYRAADYDELIDHPVEIGTFETQYFEAHGIPHQIVVTGRHSGDLARLGRDVKKICEAHIDLFGAPAPIDRYVFLLTVVGEGYGGLEHRWSSSLIACRDELPRFEQDTISERYRRLLGLFSHEYFHLWNVKRIRPAPVAHSDLSTEAYTRDLWIFEGITSYYDDLALLRSGVIDLKSYLELLSNTASVVWLGRGRFTQSLAESSYDAWIKLYKRDDNFPNTQVNYYTKGAMVALALDLLIRARSGSARSLDDCMRVLWQRHGAADEPLAEGVFESIAAETSGVELKDFFNAVVRGVADPPLAELLAEVGCRFDTAPVRDGERKPLKREAGTPVPPALQVGTRAVGGRIVLTTIYADGPGQHAGLCSGDELVALNGLRVTADNFQRVIEHFRPGQTIAVDFFRRDELHRAEATLDPAPDAGVAVSVDEGAGAAAVERRRLWLEGQTA